MRWTNGLMAAVAATVALAGLLEAGNNEGGKRVPEVLKFDMTAIDGKKADLSQYAGKVILFVNVASRCGYTPQYKGLQELYTKYKDRGLVVIGVPANNFGGQEPGTNEEIAQFCSTNYGVTFPMLAKVSVKGNDITPLYKYLTENAQPPGDVKWNFEKFLIGRDGKILARFPSAVRPEDPKFIEQIEKALDSK
jgi:glutathione peroxidase